jgi:hypothetical protein
MTKFEVTFRVAASQGGQIEKVCVDAKDEVEAMTAATLKLEDDKGIDRCSLVKIVKVTS